MKSRELSIIAASAALSFMACSDDATSASKALEEAANYTQTTSTTYTCTDGSQVFDATLCPSGVADSVVTTTITCADGSEVEDASLCAPVAASSAANAGGFVAGSSASESGSSASALAGSSAATVTSSASNSGVIPPASSQSAVVVPVDNDKDSDLEDAKTLDGSEIMLNLAGTSATVDNNNGCVQVEEKRATITCAGDYYVSGTSTDFQIVVNTPATEGEGNTGLYLHNATIKSSDAAILVKNADKAVLHLVKGTTNSVEDGSGAHVFEKVNGTQDTAKAAIYSRDDMNIKGAGKLTVNGKFKNGIQCSNDLKIKNGDITVVAEENGIKGKGSLVISGGTLNITAKNGDGLESDECEEAADGSCSKTVDGKGVVVISGGKVSVNAGDDGISGYNYVMISDSTEASTVDIKSTDKGIASENMVYVNGGTMSIETSTDGISSGLNVWMNGGNVTISAKGSSSSNTNGGWGGSSGPKSQGIHADSTLYLNGSTVNIVTAEEGIEAFYIRAQAGITSTYATDDGWNAAGGSDDNSNNTGNQGGFGGMMSSTKGYIYVTGGYHYISASGNDIDVLDANGTATQSGGVLILEILSSSGNSYGGMNFAGGFNPGGNQGGFPGGNQGGNGGCSKSRTGGIIDTDSGFTITGGILLGFGDITEDYPSCVATGYTNANFYGDANAAFKPQGANSIIIYGGSVTSVGVVETAGMTEVKFPNGLSYMYK